jgi:hypothetical protein
VFHRPAAQQGGPLFASTGEAGEAGAAGVPSSFFNRTLELKGLAESLAVAPTGVLVMTGPPSCGKSGVLHELGSAQFQAAELTQRPTALLMQYVASVKQLPKPSVVNCRTGGAFCRA